MSVIGLLTGGLERLALLPDAAAKACRAFTLCGPRPLNTLPPFEVVHGSGSTWEQVEKDDVPPEQGRLSAQNPDFTIVWHRGQETGGCSGPFNTTCRYHYHGWWSAVPKWETVSKLPWIVLGACSSYPSSSSFVAEAHAPHEFPAMNDLYPSRPTPDPTTLCTVLVDAGDYHRRILSTCPPP